MSDMQTAKKAVQDIQKALDACEGPHGLKPAFEATSFAYGCFFAALDMGGHVDRDALKSVAHQNMHAGHRAMCAAMRAGEKAQAKGSDNAKSQ